MSEEKCTSITTKEPISDDVPPPQNDANKEISVQSDEDNKPEISRKKMKRMQKHEKWIATKGERRKREKEKVKAKVARMIEAGEKIISRKERQRLLIKQCDSLCKVTVVIDCDYADFMKEPELKKLCKQLNRYDHFVMLFFQI